MNTTVKFRTVGKAGPLFFFLFGLPFACVGVFMGWMMVRQIAGSIRAENWTEVPANITSTDLRANSGGDSTTYEAKAEYIYTLNGRQYKGTRVAWGSGADNIGSFQRKAHARLEEHRAAGRPFPCRVNPANPEESILFPGVRWEMLIFQSVFVLAFGGAGFGMMAGAVVFSRRTRALTANRAASPDQPWLWNEQWRSGTIRSSSLATFLALMAFATFWNVVAWPIATLVFRDEILGKAGSGAWFVMIFPAVGLVLLSVAIYFWGKWRKYGDCTFRMAPVPGVVGGALSGVIRVPVHVRPEKGYRLTLSCVNRVTSGSGKSRSTAEHVLWREEKTLKRELLEGNVSQTALPVLFRVPYGLRPTDSSDSDNEIVWRLKATAATPGIDFSASFNVPVFVTASSSPDFVLDESGLAPYLAPADPGEACARERILRAARPDGSVSFDLPAARHPGSAAGLTMFWLIWTAGIIPAGEVKDVLVSCGMRSGNTDFYDLKLSTGSNRARTIATGITDRQLADRMRVDVAQAIGLKDVDDK